MYMDIPLGLALLFVAGGLWLLTWGANRFVDGSAAVAKALGVSPFVIGMVVIGFGTSAPELAVSALSGFMGHANLSLGNAYGSNIFNIAIVLGVAALIRPIRVRPAIIAFAVPLLVGVSFLSCLLVRAGGTFSRLDGLLSLGAFAVLLPAYCWFDRRSQPAGAGAEADAPADVRHPWAMLAIGLAVLVASSHLLVWGAIDLARAMGVSELFIGLTVVAAGTSLPELASAVVSARKGQHEFVLGNIIGSNFFNALVVVGVSGTISPFRDVSPAILTRDLGVMVALSLSIGLFGLNLRRPREDGKISRLEAGLWIVSFLAYLLVTVAQERA